MAVASDVVLRRPQRFGADQLSGRFWTGFHFSRREQRQQNVDMGIKILFSLTLLTLAPSILL